MVAFILCQDNLCERFHHKIQVTMKHYAFLDK